MHAVLATSTAFTFYWTPLTFASSSTLGTASVASTTPSETETAVILLAHVITLNSHLPPTCDAPYPPPATACRWRRRSALRSFVGHWATQTILPPCIQLIGGSKSCSATFCKASVNFFARGPPVLHPLPPPTPLPLPFTSQWLQQRYLRP